MLSTKLQSLLVYRLEHSGKDDGVSPLLLATFNNNGKVAKFVKRLTSVISNSMPTIPPKQHDSLGGFKVQRHGDMKLVFAADNDAICYCVVTDLGYADRVAMQCAGEMAKRFQATLGRVALDATEHSLNKASKALLASVCSKFEDSVKVNRAQRQKKNKLRGGNIGKHPNDEDSGDDVELKQLVSAIRRSRNKGRGKPMRVRFLSDHTEQESHTYSVQQDICSEATPHPFNLQSAITSAWDYVIASLLLGKSTELLPPPPTTSRDNCDGCLNGLPCWKPVFVVMVSDSGDDLNQELYLPTSSWEVGLSIRDEVESRSSFGSSSDEFIPRPFESLPTLFPYDVPTGLSFCGYSVTSSSLATTRISAGFVASDSDETQSRSGRLSSHRSSDAQSPDSCSVSSKVREAGVETEPSTTIHVPYSMEEIINELRITEDEEVKCWESWEACEPPCKRHDKKPTPPQMKQQRRGVPAFITI